MTPGSVPGTRYLCPIANHAAAALTGRVMRYAIPRPLDDDAWRVSDASPGIAHFFGWADGNRTSRCWAAVPSDGTRQATEDDQLCPDCDGWYWQHVSASWLAYRETATSA